MESVMVSRGMELTTQNKPRGLSFRQQEVVELCMVYPPKEVAELTGYSIPSVHRIINSEDALAHKKLLMELYDHEFESLFPQAVKAVRDGLNSADEKVKLSAAQIWLKAHGKLQGDNNGQMETKITAEQIVVQILNQARQEQKAN